MTAAARRASLGRLCLSPLLAPLGHYQPCKTVISSPFSVVSLKCSPLTLPRLCELKAVQELLVPTHILAQYSLALSAQHTQNKHRVVVLVELSRHLILNEFAIKILLVLYMAQKLPLGLQRPACCSCVGPCMRATVTFPGMQPPVFL